MMMMTVYVCIRRIQIMQKNPKTMGANFACKTLRGCVIIKISQREWNETTVPVYTQEKTTVTAVSSMF